MTLLAITPNLTRAFDADTWRAINKTHVGMAHFAGTGPANAKCRQCAFWRDAKLAATQGVTIATLKPATCAKFQQLTNKQGQKVPHSASACKYFEAYRS